MASNSRLGAAFLLVLACAGSPAEAQRGRFRGPPPDTAGHFTPYDGRFTFARLKYTTGPGGYYYQGLPAWAHGYQHAEDNLMRIMREVSAVRPHLDASNLLAMDDPRLFQYPVAYMTEAGYWTMTDKEAASLRAYLLKGGFIIFDDFRDNFGNPGWYNFAAQMKRVLPDVRFYDLQPTHPIFHSFFEISTFSIIPQMYDRGSPILRAVYEHNDPSKRLLAIINFNTDVSDFWEFSAVDMRPIAENNEAYKLGVNYIVYGLTH